MKTFQRTYYVIAAVATVCGIVLFWALEWPVPAILIALVAAHLLIRQGMRGYYYLRNPWFRRLHRTVRRLRRGQAEATIAKLETQRAAGDNSPATLITLAAAYNYVGRGEDAAPLVDAATHHMIAHRLCERRDLSAPQLCELVRLVQFDALVAQGRFAEAAHGLRPHVARALNPSLMIFAIAWGLFLANQTQEAQTVLEHYDLPETFRARQAKLDSLHQFMLEYLCWRVLGAETLEGFRIMHRQFRAWEAEAERNAHNPYGARLYHILEDIRPLLITSITWAN